MFCYFSWLNVMTLYLFVPCFDDIVSRWNKTFVANITVQHYFETLFAYQGWAGRFWTMMMRNFGGTTPTANFFSAEQFQKQFISEMNDSFITFLAPIRLGSLRKYLTSLLSLSYIRVFLRRLSCWLRDTLN